jgi:hypothetical protein
MWVNPGDISKIKFGDSNLQTPVAGIFPIVGAKTGVTRIRNLRPNDEDVTVQNCTHAERKFHMKSGIRAHRAGPVIIHVTKHQRA